MSYLAIILFFIISWGLGYSVTRFTKRADNFLERNLMDIGIGLGVFSILATFLNFIRIPLNWWLFALLAMLLPAYDIARNYRILNIKEHFKLTKSNICIIIVLLIFAFSLYMYEKGSFAYPYLEDDDSWEHARSIKYIAIEKTAFEPVSALSLPGHGLFHYLDPYPPSYGMLLGILHQISPSLNWTLKFFNALIISLSIIFFYFFAKEFTGNSQKALLATIVLAAVPAYLSHFIWSLSLSMALYFVAFYCMERIRHDKNWLYPAALTIAAILVTQTTLSVKFAIFFGIYWLIKAVSARNFQWHLFLAAPLGALLAALFWWIPMAIKYSSLSALLRGLGQTGVEAIFTPTANRFYTFSTFFFAEKQNMINSPVGIGIVISILTILGAAYILFAFPSVFRNKEDRIKFSYIAIVMAWFIFNLLSVLGSYLPIRLDFHRSWMLLAFTVAIIAAEAMYLLAEKAKQLSIPHIVTYLVLFSGIWFTAGMQKYTFNTSPGWPPGFIWNSGEELQAYYSLQQNLPVNAKVYPLCGPGDKKLIGFDKLVFSWRDEGAWEYKTLDQAAVMKPEEAANYITSRGYSFMIADGDCFKPTYFNGKEMLPNPLGNNTPRILQSFADSGRFRIIFQNQGAVVFAVS
ncbi:hypothetical protein HYV81_03535 [Candidatus Woesearchaeota archaeon]|nr:hypothetical protein [Candidatus Woesearchaeota archaeon]